MNKCQNCRFADVDGEQLYCHRFPPGVVISADGIHFPFPAVAKESWCGEFKMALKRLFKGHGS